MAPSSVSQEAIKAIRGSDRGWPSAGADNMSFLKKLFARGSEAPQRVRICVECGMPIAEHKEWCSIRQYQQESDRKAAGKSASS